MSRPLRAVTIDLWGTIFNPRDVDAKIERRLTMLLDVLVEAGHQTEASALGGSYWEVERLLEGRVGTDHTLGPATCWAALCDHLGVPAGLIPFARCASAYEGLTLEFPPSLMPGVGQAIELLASKYRIALVCNTFYTGGRVLEEVLKFHGLRDYFNALVFSEDVGYAKPDPRIFEHALALLDTPPAESLHIGEVEGLDVAGARSTGMLTARYLPSGLVPTEADLAFEDWHDFDFELKKFLDGAPPLAIEHEN